MLWKVRLVQDAWRTTTVNVAQIRSRGKGFLAEPTNTTASAAKSSSGGLTWGCDRQHQGKKKWCQR
eukprot:6428215-Amphidinium_carterae.1